MSLFPLGFVALFLSLEERLELEFEKREGHFLAKVNMTNQIGSVHFWGITSEPFQPGLKSLWGMKYWVEGYWREENLYVRNNLG